MDKLPVGQLPDLQQSNNNDEIMVITNSEYSQLKKEKISDLITDFTSADENNALTKGTDGKMFVTDFGNASNITEGTLPVSVLPDIPKDLLPAIETTDLPVSGVTADTYAYPSSVTVNAQGQVTAIEEGTPSGSNADTDLSNLTETGESHFANPDLSNLTAEGEKHFLNKNQITNCILSAPNGVATYSGNTITVKQGLKVLIPNGRNEDKTLKNIEYTMPEDKTINYTGVGNNTYDFTLLYGNTGVYAFSQNYQEADTPPTFYGAAQYYLNTKENIMYFNNNNERWEPRTVAVLGKGRLENGVVTSFTPYQPVELLKRTDKEQITSWSFPSSKYIDLTLGASGSTYTAPANGWFVLNKTAGRSGEFIGMNTDAEGNSGVISMSRALGAFPIQVSCPIAKGEKLLLMYSASGETMGFYFVYAQGEEVEE